MATEDSMTDRGTARTLQQRQARQCLGCDSTDTVRNGRVLRCRKCEVIYFIPAVQLMQVARHLTSVTA